MVFSLSATIKVFPNQVERQIEDDCQVAFAIRGEKPGGKSVKGRAYFFQKKDSNQGQYHFLEGILEIL